MLKPCNCPMLYDSNNQFVKEIILLWHNNYLIKKVYSYAQITLKWPLHADTFCKKDITYMYFPTISGLSKLL